MCRHQQFLSGEVPKRPLLVLPVQKFEANSGEASYSNIDALNQHDTHTMDTLCCDRCTYESIDDSSSTPSLSSASSTRTSSSDALSLGSSDEGYQSGEKADLDNCIEQKSNNKKKTVRFADECGFTLVTQKMLIAETSETENSQEEMSMEFILRLVMEKKRQRESRAQSFWFLNFDQPAADPVRFRSLLQTQNIALYRVLIVPSASTLETAFDRLFGIIMTENIFTTDKKHRLRRVFVRFTLNHWQTWTENNALRLSPDRFKFFMELPRTGLNTKMYVEFCVGMQMQPISSENADNATYNESDSDPCLYHWDNNGGKNFGLFLIKKSNEIQ